ncbi:hypothetical protein AB0B63_05210 [Micromonospora sp. NPDC049081]|uniref:hypothetical protein n=1 Tax=Micromonospora sp. NPDC049081 TaxID=3155150 RepID=UPI0033F6C449
MTDADPDRDTAVHLLCQYDHGPAGDGPGVRRPIGLAEAADLWRRALESGRAAESTVDAPEEGDDVIAFSTARAHVVAALLEEFAARVEPGRSTPAVRADDSLAELATQLARHLESGTGH